MKNILTKTSCLLFLYCLTATGFAQTPELYPSNWWVGMKWNKVQILVRGTGDNFNSQNVNITYPGVQLQKVNRLSNSNYYALDLVISAAAKPGTVQIVFADQNKKTVANWPLQKRRDGNGKSFAQGVNSQDLVYLLMPDRFSNGDPTNDKIAGLRDQTLNRDSMYHRHGGDLQGVINHLDYLQDLGVTAVWMTPVFENNMPDRTEHGYAITNHYKIEPRFGSAEKYQQLSNELHKRGMKLVQDAVYNHVGIQHFTVQDKPTKDWLHEWPFFTQTTYKDQVLFDPYASKQDKAQLSDGWFTRQMPDLNQNNPYVANYLIQHALWTVEMFGVDGWRIDTYIYNDLAFMNRCNQALYTEYPNITLFGETWVHGVPNQSYFTANNYNIPFKSNLQSTTDFQTLFYGIQPALNEKFGWTEGVNKLYTTAAQDFVYKDASRQVIFLDNHDLSRFYSVLNEDIAKYKMALSWLLTFRGVPQLYYGNEILMTGFSSPDGLVRSDFMGGWKTDSLNKFLPQFRTDKENDLFNHLKTLANFRKNSDALKNGKFMQYLPQDGLYTYFRYTGSQTVACIMNTSENTKNVNLVKDFSERSQSFTRTKNIQTGIPEGMEFTIPAKTMYVLELVK